jgi:hypothetical protein
MLLGMIYLGSSSAFTAFASVGVIALAASYGVPLCLRPPSRYGKGIVARKGPCASGSRCGDTYCTEEDLYASRFRH